jgi:hypothetical protein
MGALDEGIEGTAGHAQMVLVPIGRLQRTEMDVHSASARQILGQALGIVQQEGLAAWQAFRLCDTHLHKRGF